MQVSHLQVAARLSPESQDSIVSAQQTLCAQMNTIVTNRKSLLAILQVSHVLAATAQHKSCLHAISIESWVDE